MMAGTWKCRFCEKDNFKTERGYHHHLTTAKACQRKQESETARMREMMAAIKEQERILLNSGRRVTRSETTRHRLATLFSHDEDAQEIIGTNLVVQGHDEGKEDVISEEFSNAFDQDFDEMPVDEDSEEDEEDSDNEGKNVDIRYQNDPDVYVEDLQMLHNNHLSTRGINCNQMAAQDPQANDELESNAEANNYQLSDNNESDQSSEEIQPDDTISNRIRAFCDPSRFIAPLSPTEKTGVRLLDVLRRCKTQLNAYPEVFEWHLKENGIIGWDQSARDAGDKYVGREKLMKRLTQRYGMAEMAPTERTITLPSSKEVIKIPVHQFRDCLQQLLTDPRIKDDHFCWFDNNPMAAPPEDLDYFGDINTGKAFSDAYHQLIDCDVPNQQLLGVIFYIDGAATGQFADLPVTILKMSLTCFTREARTLPYCWANLGYIPLVKMSDSRGKKLLKEADHLESQDVNIQVGEGDNVDADDTDADEDSVVFTDIKAQDYHAILSVILESFVKAQATGMLFNLKYAGKMYHNVHFIFFTPMVKCDTEEGDMLCGKYKSRTKNVKHLCRYCHVPTDKADRYTANYKYKTQAEIEKLIRRQDFDRLREMSQHYLKNAWYKIRFGNKRGIHGATPSDKLHAILLGIFKYTREIFFKMVGDSAAVSYDINALGKVYGKLFSHQSDRSFGSTNFTKGIKEGKLMAKDYRGVLLNMAAILRSTKGREMLHTKQKFKKKSTKGDWLMLVETLLQWEAYLNEPTMLKSLVERLRTKHKALMYLLKKVANRTTGMGLKIMKFHVILHMVDDIKNFGVPMEFDTGANESHHKKSKHAAKLTQRNEANFNIQVAKRLFDFLVLDMANEEVNCGNLVWEYYDFDNMLVGESEAEEDSEDQWSMNLDQSNKNFCQPSSSTSSKSSLIMGQTARQNFDQMCQQNFDQPSTIVTDDCMIQVYFDEEKDAPAFRLLSRSKSAAKTILNPELLAFLFELQVKVSDHIPQEFLPIYTRHTRNGQIFHGHPNYRGKGCWKDWAIVDWGQDGQLCAHIHCFVILEGMPKGMDKLSHGGVVLEDNVLAVVESTTFEEEEEGEQSALFVPILKDVGGVDAQGKITSRQFSLAPTNAFLYPACVIPDIGGAPNRYFFVHSRTSWSEMFVEWLKRPHREDDISDEDNMSDVEE